MANLRIAKIAYDHHPIDFVNGAGPSIGQMIDDHISGCVAVGCMVQEITLEFSPEDWHRVAGSPMGDVAMTVDPPKFKKAKTTY
jgi:hypothetical protein